MRREYFFLLVATECSISGISRGYRAFLFFKSWLLSFMTFKENFKNLIIFTFPSRFRRVFGLQTSPVGGLSSSLSTPSFRHLQQMQQQEQQQDGQGEDGGGRGMKKSVTRFTFLPSSNSRSEDREEEEEEEVAEEAKD